MKLALVVPALNEEDAIASTLRRCLAAREKVVAETFVSELVVVFVNDGSTDRTQQIVDQSEFDEVVKVRFERNRGYGAAIKAGWQATDAQLLGFIDGDGTCDPDFCVNLLKRMGETEADVVLAGRLNPESKMPLIRKIGNVLFARLLGLVSGNDLTDSASGFRIVRRPSLRLMSPLPDGLHFTPAMSCICLLDRRLRIEEVPMPYEERIGRSKLSVVKDGLRFLFTILFSACCYAPIKTMLGASVIVTLVTAIAAWLLAWQDAGVAATFGVAAAVALIVQMLATGLICHQLTFLLIGSTRAGVAERLLQQALYYKRLIVGGTLCVVAGAAGMLIGSVFHVALELGEAALLTLLIVTWLLAVAGGMAAFGGVVLRVIWAVSEKQKAMLRDSYPVRTPTALGESPSPDPTLAETLVNGMPAVSRQ